MKAKVNVGDKFGRLTAIEKEINGKWLCKCECGRYTEVREVSLYTGNTRSCGCLRKEQSSERLKQWSNNEPATTKPRKGNALGEKYISSETSTGKYLVAFNNRFFKGREKFASMSEAKEYRDEKMKKIIECAKSANEAGQNIKTNKI